MGFMYVILGVGFYYGTAEAGFTYGITGNDPKRRLIANQLQKGAIISIYTLSPSAQRD